MYPSKDDLVCCVKKEVTSVLSTRVSASIFDLDPSTTKSHKQQQRQ